MSKNMTRKGLAIGAGVALIGSALVAAPAQANITGFVTLEPSSGFKSAYAVLAGNGNTFSLTATQGATAIHSGRELKFLVTDPEAKFEPTTSSAARSVSIANAATFGATTAEVITITQTGIGSAIAKGDIITFPSGLLAADNTNGTDDGVAADNLVTNSSKYEVTDSTANAITFTTDVTIAATIAAGTDLNDTQSLKVLREARAANNSFVVDTGVADGTAQALILAASDGVTRTVKVQAWVDFVENDVIDSLDYISPEREVTFVAKADLAGSVTLQTPNIGNTSLNATFSTSPVLNGAQVNQSDLFGVVFTRQGSSQKAIHVRHTNTQSTTTGLWSATVSLGAAPDLKGWVDKNTDIADIDLTSPTRNDWGFIVPTNRAGVDGADAGDTDPIQSVAVATTGVVTVTTLDDHNLRTGDKITMTAAAADDVDSAVQATAVAVTVTGAKTFTFTLTATTKPTAAESDSDLQAGTAYTVTDAQVVRVFPGDYSATLAMLVGATSTLKYDVLSTASTFGTQAVLADDVEFTTVASASVQGAKVTSNDTTTDSLVKAGTTSVTVTATVVDEDDAPVGAGRSVAWSFAVGANTTIKVNNVAWDAATTPLTTDANGQVTFTVTDTTGADGKKVTITATPEGVTAAQSAFSVEWDTAAVQMYDLNVTNAGALATGDRYVAPGASYNLGIFVADQWYQPVADADFRLAVTGSGVTEGFVPLVAGKATVKVTDAKVATSFASTVTVQKKGTTGVFANTTTTATITTKTTDKASLTLGANATTLYGGVTVDTADLVAKVALVERDTRAAFTAQPLYVNDVVLAGKATFTATGASVPNSVVTVSGPTNILFSNGAVDKRGSITLVADANGEFAVTLYSTTAQTDTVITVTANGVSSTTKVTFTGIGVGEGTKLDVTAPANVKPASTFQVKAKLSDVFGNGVEAAAGRVKVTYTGPGIVFGTLPDKTDKNGELMFSVLLGSNDTGNVVVTVSYDQNGDADYVDAKDLNTTKTVAVGTGAAAGTGKVNVGSFNGKLVVYASGLSGKTISWKVGGRWGKAVASSNYAVFNRPTPVAGATVSVDIYVDGVKTLTKSVVTR